MKKTFIFISTALLLAACSESDVLEVKNEEPSESAAQSQIRTVEEAYEIASRSISWIDEPESRSVIRLLPSKDKVKIVKDKESRGECSDTLMYVINFEDEQGFAVIPASRKMPELLAVTESGSYDPEVGSEIEGLNEYMTLATRELQSGGTFVGEPMMEQKREEQELYVLSRFGQESSYIWGQHGIEGKYFEDKKCGCAPLAAALTLAYFGYPETITLKHHNDSVINLNWTEIRKHNSKNDIYQNKVFISCPENVSAANQDALSWICKEISDESTLYAGTDSAKIVPSTIYSTLTNLGYSIITNPTFEDRLYTDERFFIGFTQSPEKPNHMWVIDGFKRSRYEIKTYQRINDPLTGQISDWEYISSSYEIREYVHHNWGWSGKCNGWFSSGVWKTDKAAYYDEDIKFIPLVNIYDFMTDRYVYNVRIAPATSGGGDIIIEL